MKDKKAIAYYTTKFSFNQFSLLRNFEKMLSNEFELHFFVPKDEYKKFEEQGLEGYEVHFFSGVKDLFTTIPNECKKNNIKVISNLINFTVHGFHISIIAKRAGIRSVGFVGNEHMSSYKRVRSTIFKLKLILIKNLFGGCVTANLIDVIQTLGPNIKKDIEKGVCFFSKDKVKILPQPINTDKFKTIHKNKARKETNLPLDKKIILFVGRVDYLKGMDRLVEIAEDFSDDFEFCIVGSGSWKDEDDSEVSYINKMKNLSNTNFIGPVPHEEISFYYNATDALLLPSRLEGLPHVLMEAMACGVPVVASDVGDISSLCPPGTLATEENYTEKINQALQEKEKLGKSSRRKIEEEFSVEALRSKYINFFEDVI